MVGRNCSGGKTEGNERGERSEEDRDAPVRMILVKLEDENRRTLWGSVACRRVKKLQTHPRSQHKIAYMSSLLGGIYCRSSIKSDSRCRPDCVQDTPYDPGEVHDEWSTGENDRDLYECESSKIKGSTELTCSKATARKRKRIQKYS